MAQIDPILLSKDNRIALIRGTAGAMVALALVAVWARCYVKLRIVKMFGKEDWLMVFSMLAFLGYFALIIWGSTAGGLGRHILTISQKEIEIGGEAILLAYLIYTVSLVCFKVSIGLLLVRLQKHNKIWVWTLYGGIFATIFTGFFAFFWLLFQCWPVQWFWAASGRESHCRNNRDTINSIFAFSAVDIFVDWLFALLPIPMILKLKMDLASKLSIAALMAMGILASIATIARCAYIRDISSSSDIFWNYNIFIIWTNIELGLGNTVACLLTLRPLLAKFGIIKHHHSTAQGRRGAAYNQPPPGRRSSMPRMASWFKRYQDEAEGGSDDAVIMADHDKVYHSSASDLESGTGLTEIHEINQEDTLTTTTPMSQHKTLDEHIADSRTLTPPTPAYTPPVRLSTKNMHELDFVTIPADVRDSTPKPEDLSNPASRTSSLRFSTSNTAQNS